MPFRRPKLSLRTTTSVMNEDTWQRKALHLLSICHGLDQNPAAAIISNLKTSEERLAFYQQLQANISSDLAKATLSLFGTDLERLVQQDVIHSTPHNMAPETPRNSMTDYRTTFASPNIFRFFGDLADEDDMVAQVESLRLDGFSSPRRGGGYQPPSPFRSTGRIPM